MAGQMETGKLGLKKLNLSNDRISQLPDCILLHILSFLPTKQVVQTSVFSNRWKLLWTGISKIKLVEHSDDIQKLSRFVDLVGRMLFMSSGIHLDKFYVEFRAAKFTTTLNLWAQFLVKYKVKDITLRHMDGISLPQLLYSHSSMTSLTLLNVCTNPQGAIKWVSLKSLSLCYVNLPDDSVMEKILLGSPVLEVLHLTGCRGLNNLNIISSATLATLVIEINLGKEGAIGFLEISAPHVLDLSIRDNSDGDYMIKNVSSVFRAKIFIRGDIEDTESKNCTKQSLRNLHSVKELELGAWVILVLSEMEMEGMQSPTSRVKSLTLNPWTDKRSILGIVNILKSSPMLETLAIIEDIPYDDEETQYLVGQAAAYLQNGNMDLVLTHLKTIKITTFTDSIDSFEPMVTLLQILFKGAMQLEKMIIRAKFLDINKLAVKLISFPRSSPKSVVMFE